MKRLIEEAKRLIKINSETLRGNEELVNHLDAVCQDRGLAVTVSQVTHSFESISKRQFNIVAILGDPLVDRKIRKGLLLSAHLDTADPGRRENWTETQGNPFEATIKSDKIYGLGAADAKLDFLCKLHAVSKFRERKLKQPIYLLGTCGEKVGMFGAKYLIKSLALNPKYVMVGAPTELNLATAHKSFMVYRVVIGFQQIERDARGFNRKVELISLGTSAHSADPDSGKNAILAVFQLLRQAVGCGFEFRFTQFSGGEAVNKVPDRAVVQLFLTSHQLEDFKRFFKDKIREDLQGDPPFGLEFGASGNVGKRFLPDSLFPCLLEIIEFFEKTGTDFQKLKEKSYVPPYSSVNFGSLKQGPGVMTLHFDVRLLPDLSPSEVEDHIKKGISSIACSYPHLNISIAKEQFTSAFKSNSQSEFLKVCKEAMIGADVAGHEIKISSTTEASPFADAGFDVFVFGPGKIESNSHSPNEHNHIEQLEKAVVFYEKLIEKVCL